MEQENKRPWFKPQITLDSIISIGGLLLAMSAYVVTSEHRFTVLEAFAANQVITNSTEQSGVKDFRDEVAKRFDRLEQKLDKQWSLRQK